MRRYGGAPAVGLLVEFRTSLAWPARWVTWEQFDGVTRYREPADTRRAVAAHVEHGTLTMDASGFRASDHGQAFLRELLGLRSRVLGQLRPGAEPLLDPVDRVRRAAHDSGGAALTASGS